MRCATWPKVKPDQPRSPGVHRGIRTSELQLSDGLCSQPDGRPTLTGVRALGRAFDALTRWSATATGRKELRSRRPGIREPRSRRRRIRTGDRGNWAWHPSWPGGPPAERAVTPVFRMIARRRSRRLATVFAAATSGPVVVHVHQLVGRVLLGHNAIRAVMGIFVALRTPSAAAPSNALTTVMSRHPDRPCRP